MKAIDFLNKFTSDEIPTLARMIAQKAVRELNEGNFDPVEVTELEFYLVSKYAEYQPINPALGTKFIRIFDNEDNAKDIQILDPWKK